MGSARRQLIGVLAVFATAGALVVAPSIASAATPVSGTVSTVASGSTTGFEDWQVEITVHGPTGAVDTVATTTDADGGFAASLGADIPADGVMSVIAHAPEDPSHPGVQTATLATVVAELTPGGVVTVNERTTIAASWAMAQFIGNDGISGAAPGLRNAAGMAANVADPTTGAASAVLTDRANRGISSDLDPLTPTSTAATFASLTAALASCVAEPFGDPAFAEGTCEEIISIAAQAQDPADPADTFRALAEIARNAGVADPAELFALTTLVPLADGAPTLAAAPAAWTLAIRFDGDGQSLDGPGNFAVDHDGNLWVNNNYTYHALPTTTACGSDELFRFSPIGEFTKFSGGGLSGSGFGIELDVRTGELWVSNFGFAAPDCDIPPPHNTMSLFNTVTETFVVETPFDQGPLDWPQGVVIDGHRNVWTANCSSDTVTLYPDLDPYRARNITAADGLDTVMAFDVVDNGSAIFASGMLSSSVQMIAYDGTPFTTVGGAGFPGRLDAFANPMGLAPDADGNVWVANSGIIRLPCDHGSDSPPPNTIDLSEVAGAEFDDNGAYTGSGPNPYRGSVAMISPDGSVVQQYGVDGVGGSTLPWGIATDGDGNVWVANFDAQRLSAYCGADPATCPPGLSTGDPISPDDTGFFFDGLVRNTGVAIDQSGNVWVANNWLTVPLQSNPGGHQIVAFLGMAAPVSIPAPDLPAPTPTPDPTGSPQPTGSPAPTVAPTPELAASGSTGAPAGAIALAAAGLMVLGALTVHGVRVSRRRR